MTPRALAPGRRPAIGARRTRLVIEKPIETPDGLGGVLRRFVQGDSVWAAVRPLSADASLLAGSLGQSLTHRVVLGWRADLTAGHRLRLGARLFRLHSVIDPDERRRDLVCYAEEIRP